ncbi:hypothetical protein C1922_04165 [Stenotrophomonas sp. ZAC14D2_NAIMI4_7]|uniref:hypothetical protein n=1 Tax=Stenotrophomonas sp. ZAC14D2_NAIMI4_7 TaxID=2072405 RepID=UPI000D5403E3|nr:hypothetical protein [Stenotrophomonas sp. ZAC14D2_NAIMI4_7]AWH16579.1 hypothetical protein C1922_04165 [Stenotrophomonas sp. ZAC14D2_NAIMI4_7]
MARGLLGLLLLLAVAVCAVIALGAVASAFSLQDREHVQAAVHMLLDDTPSWRGGLAFVLQRLTTTLSGPTGLMLMIAVAAAWGATSATVACAGVATAPVGRAAGGRLRGVGVWVVRAALLIVALPLLYSGLRSALEVLRGWGRMRAMGIEGTIAARHMVVGGTDFHIAVSCLLGVALLALLLPTLRWRAAGQKNATR